jgi:hypothetical protein
MKQIIKPIFLATFLLLLFSAINASAQGNQSNYRLQFAKGKKSVSQSRSIKKDDIHDIFFRAKKGQRVTVKISSANGEAYFNLGAMHEFDVAPIQDNTTAYSGRLPFAGKGEYVIRVETNKATKYTITVSIK